MVTADAEHIATHTTLAYQLGLMHALAKTVENAGGGAISEKEPSSPYEDSFQARFASLTEGTEALERSDMEALLGTALKSLASVPEDFLPSMHDKVWTIVNHLIAVMVSQEASAVAAEMVSPEEKPLNPRPPKPQDRSFA